MSIHYLDEKERYIIDSVGKYFSDERICNIFCNKQIRFTPPNDFNDPLEFKPILKGNDIHDGYKFQEKHYPSKAEFISRAIIEYYSKRYGVLSLTKAPDSFYMWSMYANGHKGFFLVFKDDFNKQKDLRDEEYWYPIKEVRYSDDYSLEIKDGFIDQNFVDEFAKNNYKKIFFTKTNRWRDEGEYRIVRPLKDKKNKLKKSLFEFKISYITDVIFGVSMSVENKLKIKKLCANENKNINFHQATIVKDKKDHTNKLGKVLIYDIQQDFSWEMLKEADELSLFIDSEILKGKEKIISKLDELPYPPERVIIKKYKSLQAQFQFYERKRST